MVVSEKLQGDLKSNSGVPLASFLVFQYKKTLTTSLLTAACLIKDSDVSNASPGWWLVAVAQEQTPSCFLCPSDCQAASCDFHSQVTQVIMLLEAWGDCELSGDANSVAMSGRLDFPRQACSPVTQTCLGEIEVVGDGSPRVLSTSVGTYSGCGAQDVTRLLMDGPEQIAGGDSCHALASGLIDGNFGLWLYMAGTKGCWTTQSICKGSLFAGGCFTTNKCACAQGVYLLY